jgi:hypothetical protein
VVDKGVVDKDVEGDLWGQAVCIQAVRDAQKTVDMGVDGIVVRNHAGRQVLMHLKRWLMVSKKRISGSLESKLTVSCSCR